MAMDKVRCVGPIIICDFDTLAYPYLTLFFAFYMYRANSTPSP